MLLEWVVYEKKKERLDNLDPKDIMKIVDKLLQIINPALNSTQRLTFFQDALLE